MEEDRDDCATGQVNPFYTSIASDMKRETCEIKSQADSESLGTLDNYYALQLETFTSVAFPPCSEGAGYAVGCLYQCCENPNSSDHYHQG